MVHHSPLIDHQLKATTDAIIHGYQPEQIILFGSRARGTDQRGSDVDLLVVKRTRRSPMQRVRDLVGYLPHDLDADLIVLTPGELTAREREDHYLMNEIRRTGRIIYQRARHASRR